MTEADWLTGTDFTAHVRYIADRLSPRRQRLLAAAFCRAVSHLFDHPDLHAALRVIEGAADGAAPLRALEEMRQRCRELATESYEEYRVAVEAGRSDSLRAYLLSELGWLLAFAANSPIGLAEVGARAMNVPVSAATGWTEMLIPYEPGPAEHDRAVRAEALRMRGVVWEVVGNPFRPIAFDPAWRTDTAVTLARTMYENREFSATPILADALQDAGCDSDDILNHCRDTTAAHVRGCWVVDLVLGKE